MAKLEDFICTFAHNGPLLSFCLFLDVDEILLLKRISRKLSSSLYFNSDIWQNLLTMACIEDDVHKCRLNLLRGAQIKLYHIHMSAQKEGQVLRVLLKRQP